MENWKVRTGRSLSLSSFLRLAGHCSRSGVLPGRKERRGTSLVVQWLRSCLLMQGTQVGSLVGELRSHMPEGNEAHALQLVEPMSCNEDPAKPKERKRREERREKQQTLRPRAPCGVFRQERGGLSLTSQTPSTHLQPGSSNQRGPQNTLSSAILLRTSQLKPGKGDGFLEDRWLTVDGEWHGAVLTLV